MKQKGQSQSRKGSFLGSDAKIRKRTLQESSRKKKVEGATERSWGKDGHQDSTKSISLGTRRQEESAGVYLGLDLRGLQEAENTTMEGDTRPSPTASCRNRGRTGSFLRKTKQRPQFSDHAY